MLRAWSLTCLRTSVRTYATSPSPHALILLEHRAGVLESGSLSALTAAEQLGGKVTGLVLGGSEEVKGAVAQAKK
jgi:electron transfer flavoprotein alpha subunit